MWILRQSVRNSQLWTVLLPQIHCSVDVRSTVPETAAAASSNMSSPKCHFSDTMSVLSSRCCDRQQFFCSTAPAGSAWICFASFAPFFCAPQCSKCLPCSLRETFGVWDIISQGLLAEQDTGRFDTYTYCTLSKRTSKIELITHKNRLKRRFSKEKWSE